MTGWQTIMIVAGALIYMWLMLAVARWRHRRYMARQLAARAPLPSNVIRLDTALVSYELHPPKLTEHGWPADKRGRAWPPEDTERLIGWPPRQWPS